MRIVRTDLCKILLWILQNIQETRDLINLIKSLKKENVIYFQMFPFTADGLTHEGKIVHGAEKIFHSLAQS